MITDDPANPSPAPSPEPAATTMAMPTATATTTPTLPADLPTCHAVIQQLIEMQRQKDRLIGGRYDLDTGIVDLK